jgi:DNA-binding CsgD family transcriptional regulator
MPYIYGTTMAKTQKTPATPTLTPRDCREILATAAALLEPDTHEGFVNALVQHMHRMMNAAVTGYNETDAPAKRFTFLIHPREVVQDAMVAIWVSHAAENPLYTHMVQHPDDLAVYKITDFVPIQKFRRTELCRLLYRPMGAEFQICLPIVCEKTNAVVIVFNRPTDFTERDRQRLTLLQPFVINAYKQFRRLESIIAAALDSDSNAASPRAKADQFKLPPRLKKVLALVVKGQSNAQIARQMKLSVRTIEKYVEQVLRRLNVRSRSAAVAKVLSSG